MGNTDDSDAARERLRLHVIDRARSTSRADRWFSGSNAASFRVDLDNAGFALDESIRTDQIGDALEIVIDGSFLWRNAMNCSDTRRWIAEIDARRSSLTARDAIWLAIMRTDLGQGTTDHEVVSGAITAALATANAADDDPALAIALHFDSINRIVLDPIDAADRLARVRDIAESIGDHRLVHLSDAFSALATVARGDTERGAAMARDLAGQVSGDGYEVFISNWVAWTAHLISEDVEQLRYWTDRQRDYLTRIGVRETWLTIHNMALSSAMEGEDVHQRLHQACSQAHREDLDAAADTVLALAVIARVDRRPRDAAELLGSIAGQRLNNVAHYVLRRATFALSAARSTQTNATNSCSAAVSERFAMCWTRMVSWSASEQRARAPNSEIDGAPTGSPKLLTKSRIRGGMVPMSEAATELLRRHGVQVTAQRLAIMRVVSEHPHATADELGDEVRAQLGAISRQAVYDSLGVLVEKNLIRRIQPAGSAARYENRVGDNHHHLICRGCRAMFDVDCAVGEVPCLTADDDHGFEVDEAEVIYWGYCPTCRAADTAADKAVSTADQR